MTDRPLQWWSSMDLRQELAQLNRSEPTKAVNERRSEIVREIRARQEEATDAIDR